MPCADGELELKNQDEYTKNNGRCQDSELEIPQRTWYGHVMPKKKEHQPDEYFDQLASATEEVRDRSLASDYEGQLAVDVYQTKTAIVIRAAIAGVQADDIDISVNNDMVTIKGLRHLDEEVAYQEYLYQECYWGGFSRTIILPVEVKADKVTASMKNGILRVTLPKNERPATGPIKVIDEDEE